MRPPFSGKPSPLGGPHYPLLIGEWLLPLISLGSDRGQPQVRTLPIAKSLARSSARVPPYGSFNSCVRSPVVVVKEQGCPALERKGVASASEWSGRVEGLEAGSAGLETESPRMGGPRAPRGGEQDVWPTRQRHPSTRRSEFGTGSRSSGARSSRTSNASDQPFDGPLSI